MNISAIGVMAGLAVLLFLAGVDARRRGRFSPVTVVVGETRATLRSDNVRSAWKGGAQLLSALVLTAYPEDVRVQTQLRLTRAGVEAMDALEFLALKLLVMFAAALGTGFLMLLAGQSPVWGLLLAGPAYIAPDFWLNGRLQARQKAIQRDSLEFAILLAAILKSGGVGINEALRIVGEQIGGEIGREVERTFVEIAAGRRRADALDGLVERCGVEEITEIIRCIRNADKYGIPISDALSEYASRVYFLRQARAEEKAGKMLVKVIFPMIIFYLFPLFIILFYPAIIKLGQILAI